MVTLLSYQLFIMKACSPFRALSFILLSSINPIGAQNVVLSDDMTDTFYSDFSFNGSDSGFNPDDISFATWDTDSSGGNPGGVFNVFHEHDVDRDELGDPFGSSDTELQSFFLNSDLSYTPASQGAIETLSFSLDVKTFDPFESVYFVIGDSLGTSVAQGFAGTGFLTITPNGEWQTVTLSGVTQADVVSRDLSGALPLEFGFGFTSSAEVSSSPETFFLQADNFRIEVSAIPEPSSALILALGSLGLWRRRR